MTDWRSLEYPRYVIAVADALGFGGSLASRQVYKALQGKNDISGRYNIEIIGADGFRIWDYAAAYEDVGTYEQAIEKVRQRMFYAGLPWDLKPGEKFMGVRPKDPDVHGIMFELTGKDTAFFNVKDVGPQYIFQNKAHGRTLKLLAPTAEATFPALTIRRKSR